MCAQLTHRACNGKTPPLQSSICRSLLPGFQRGTKTVTAHKKEEEDKQD